MNCFPIDPPRYPLAFLATTAGPLVPETGLVGGAGVVSDGDIDVVERKGRESAGAVQAVKAGCDLGTSHLGAAGDLHPLGEVVNLVRLLWVG